MLAPVPTLLITPPAPLVCLVSRPLTLLLAGSRPLRRVTRSSVTWVWAPPLVVVCIPVAKSLWALRTRSRQAARSTCRTRSRRRTIRTRRRQVPLIRTSGTLFLVVLVSRLRTTLPVRPSVLLRWLLNSRRPMKVWHLLTALPFTPPVKLSPRVGSRCMYMLRSPTPNMIGPFVSLPPGQPRGKAMPTLNLLFVPRFRTLLLKLGTTWLSFSRIDRLPVALFVKVILLRRFLKLTRIIPFPIVGFPRGISLVVQPWWCLSIALTLPLAILGAMYREAKLAAPASPSLGRSVMAVAVIKFLLPPMSIRLQSGLLIGVKLRLPKVVLHKVGILRLTRLPTVLH